MSFNTSWNVDVYKNIFENADHWNFRREFLIANKNKFTENRLVTYSYIFIFVEFMKCRYTKPIMDLIADLSKSFVNDLREKLYGNQQIKYMTDLNYENVQAVTSKLNIDQPRNNNMKYTSPYDSNCLIPGFMLRVLDGVNAYNVIKQSCKFSGTTQPEIKYEHFNVEHIQAKLYLQNKLIAVGAGTRLINARKDVSIIACNILKEMCFTIMVKKIDVQSQISLRNNSTKAPNITKHYDQISSNNFGSKILKNMGWKEGDGLGKKSQGIRSPIEVVQLKKRAGLGVTNYVPKQLSFDEIQIQAKNHIMEFLRSPKKRLSFATEFTMNQRTHIHLFCVKNGLGTKSLGKKSNQRMLIFKKQTPREIFDELINSSNFENETYMLEPPRHESIINQ